MNQRLMTPMQRWSVILLPAILAAGLYAVWFARPMSEKIELKQSDLAQDQASTPSAETIATQQLAFSRETEQLNAEKERAANLTQRAQNNERREYRLLSTADRAAALEKMTFLFADHGLSVLGKSRLADTDAKTLLPKTLRDAVTASQSQDQAPQVWKIQVEGSFAGFLECLETMSASSEHGIVVNVSMEAAPASAPPGRRLWTLWLYL